MALRYSTVAAHIFVNSDQSQSARQMGIFLCAPSAQVEVWLLAAVGFEVWLCDFTSVAESMLPAFQKAHSHLPTL